MTTNLSRRSVAKGIAWTAPTLVVGAAAPALAGSCAAQRITKVDLTTYKRDQAVAAGGLTETSGTMRVTLADGTTMPVTLTHIANGSSLSASQDLLVGPDNNTLTFASYSGMSPYLFLQTLEKGGAGGYTGGTQTSTLTFTFPQSVSNFSFTIGDIDKGTKWNDSVTVSPAGGTYTSTAIDQTYNQTGGNQNVTVTGPTKTITISFSNNGMTGAQNFAIGNFGTSATTVCL